MVKEQKDKSYIRNLENLNLHPIEGHRFRGDMIEEYRTLKGLAGIDLDEAFSQGQRKRC